MLTRPQEHASPQQHHHCHMHTSMLLLPASTVSMSARTASLTVSLPLVSA